MSNKITKHPDLVKKEYQIKDLQQVLKKKKTNLKSLKTRLQNMQRDIEEISHKVHTHMMHKFDEIDELRQEIGDLAKKLKKSKGISEADREALSGMAEDLSGEDLFGNGYAEYKTYKENKESKTYNFEDEQRAKMQDVFDQFKVKPPEEEQRNIRKVFLKLSQKFHPDLSKTSQEESDFHDMMQQINAAYQKNDIHALLEMERLYLTEALDLTHSSITLDVLDEAIEKIEKEILFIKNQAKRTSAEIKNIRNSDMGHMLSSVNKAEREGEGFEAMVAQHNETIKIFSQLRDGLKHSIEIDAVSPKLMEMMMGQMVGELGDDDVDLEDIMSIMEMMGTADGSEDGFDLEGIFGNELDEYDDISNPKFAIGSSVRVYSKVPHKSHKRTKMNGWEGRVVRAFYNYEDEPTYLVEFDSMTIKQMPDKLMETLVEDDTDFSAHNFLESQLERSKPRDTENDTIIAFRKRFHQFKWNHLDKKQRQRLQNILLTDPELEDEDNWVNYLRKHLNFPFSAMTKGVYDDSGIPGGIRCEVKDFDFYDDQNGIVMTINSAGVKQDIPHPLLDILPIKANKKVHEVLDDYFTWADEILIF